MHLIKMNEINHYIIVETILVLIKQISGQYFACRKIFIVKHLERQLFHKYCHYKVLYRLYCYLKRMLFFDVR